MLDIKFLRENPEIVKENIKKKFQDKKLILVDEVIALDKESREMRVKGDSLRAERNSTSTSIGALMKDKKIDEANAKKAEVEFEISSFHAGAETHIYCQKQNKKGETFAPFLLGLADIYNMHSAEEKVDYKTILKGYEILKNTFVEFNM